MGSCKRLCWNVMDDAPAKEASWFCNSYWQNWGSIIWEGAGLDEIGRREDTNEIVIRIDQKYFRPTEVPNLLGDSTLAKDKLGWVPKTTLEELISEMVKVDKEEAQKELLLVRSGFEINSRNEQPPNL